MEVQGSPDVIALARAALDLITAGRPGVAVGPLRALLRVLESDEREARAGLAGVRSTRLGGEP